MSEETPASRQLMARSAVVQSIDDLLEFIAEAGEIGVDKLLLIRQRTVGQHPRTTRRYLSSLIATGEVTKSRKDCKEYVKAAREEESFHEHVRRKEIEKAKNEFRRLM